MGRKKKGFSLFGLVTDVIFSPALIYILGWFYFGDVRRATLLTLIIISSWTVMRLLLRSLKLIFQTMTLNIFGFIRTLANIIVSSVIIIGYWLTYVIFWGANFTF